MQSKQVKNMNLKPEQEKDNDKYDDDVDDQPVLARSRRRTLRRARPCRKTFGDSDGTKNNDQAIGSQKIGVFVFVDFLELCRSKFRNFFALAGTILSFSGTTKSSNKEKSSELRLIDLF